MIEGLTPSTGREKILKDVILNSDLFEWRAFKSVQLKEIEVF